jgi:hypothetical protein
LFAQKTHQYMQIFYTQTFNLLSSNNIFISQDLGMWGPEPA